MRDKIHDILSKIGLKTAVKNIKSIGTENDLCKSWTAIYNNQKVRMKLTDEEYIFNSPYTPNKIEEFNVDDHKLYFFEYICGDILKNIQITRRILLSCVSMALNFQSRNVFIRTMKVDNFIVTKDKSHVFYIDYGDLDYLTRYKEQYCNLLILKTADHEPLDTKNKLEVISNEALDIFYLGYILNEYNSPQEDVIAIVKKMAEKDPKKRFKTFKDIKNELVS